MFFVDLFVALIIGFLFTMIFAVLFESRGPWEVWWVFLLIVVLGAWVGGLWLAPMGPVWYGVTWLPFLFAGLFFALLLVAATPPAPRRRTEMTYAEAETSTGVAAFSIFFWILILGLLVAIILAYV
jgi:hypothetical protein